MLFFQEFDVDGSMSVDGKTVTMFGFMVEWLRRIKFYPVGPRRYIRLDGNTQAQDR